MVVDHKAWGVRKLMRGTCGPLTRRGDEVYVLTSVIFPYFRANNWIKRALYPMVIHSRVFGHGYFHFFVARTVAPHNLAGCPNRYVRVVQPLVARSISRVPLV